MGINSRSKKHKLKGYEGIYSITRDGAIYSHLTNKFLKPILSGDYLRVSLYKDDVMKKHCIHVLVATQFKKNPHNLPQVNHKDGVKLNNCDWNLEWCTQLENTNHAWKLGLINNKIQSRPNNKFAAKITESQAKEIKEAKGTNREIALLFGIGYKQVGRIKRGEAWA